MTKNITYTRGVYLDLKDKLEERIKTNTQEKVWRIKLFGEFWQTKAGKTVWKKKNHASAALGNELGTYWVSDVLHETMNFSDWIGNKDEIWKKFKEELIKDGILEFVEV